MFRNVKPAPLVLAAVLAAARLPTLAQPAGMPVSCAPQAASGVLTLSEAAHLALCTQPQARMAAARLASAQAQVLQGRAAQMPTLSGRVNASATHALGDTTYSRSVQLSASWVLFDFGQRSATTAAAREAVLASVMDQEATAQAVLLETARRYYDVVNARQSVDSAQAQVDAARLARQAAERRFELGEVPRLDVLQARSGEAQASLALVQAQSRLKSSTAALAQYIGLGAQANPELAEPARASDIRLPALSELVESALAQRPGARAAAARVESARQRLEAARASGKPTVSVGASTTYNESGTPGARRQTQTFVALDVPLFDAGLSDARQRDAIAQLELAEAQLRAEREATELAVVQAHVALTSAQAAVRAAESYVQASLQALEQAEGRYRTGVGALSDWLDAQAQATSARERLVAAQLDWHRAQLALAEAMGELTLSRL